METNYQIITIESIQSIGVSSQVKILSQQLRIHKNIKISKHGKLEDISKQSKEINEFLSENKSNLVLNDGSFAIDIARDIANGYNHKDLEFKYRNIIFEYEKLFHKYNMLNLILLPENIELSKKRSEKRAKLLNIPINTINLEKEYDTLLILSHLNNYTFTRNIEFKSIKVFEGESILDINEKIWDKIKAPNSRG